MKYKEFKIKFYLESYYNEFKNFDDCENLQFYWHELYNTIMNNCVDVYELCEIENNFNIFKLDIINLYKEEKGKTFKFNKKYTK